MEERLTAYRKKREYLVCADSDGSVMDTMNIKHQRCFGPCLLQVWEFNGCEQKVLELWNNLNLFSKTRGINRYAALILLLEQIRENGVPVQGLDLLKQWVQNSGELSNKSLEKEIQKKIDSGVQESLECMEKALRWSNYVNREVSSLKKEDRRVFRGAFSCLQKISKMADIAVVSSANPEALKEEWEEAKLLEIIKILMSQKDGTKAQCIETLLEKGYSREKTMMIGDAPGDARAALDHGVWFYPILAGRETESWKRLETEVFDQFVSGGFNQVLQEELYRSFCNNLNMSV